jgi:Xaa-Pro aminopeptidase
MVHFLKWLEDNIGKTTITEVSAAKKLKSLRAAQPGFVGESFGTISGYAGHGAIVHYNANAASDVELKAEGLFLIDSGGQYHGGTTDITRTLALGAFPEQAKTDYTLVLKGHIALACAIFPQGTRGVHLDILARKALWQHGLNYGHGTGHGIGYFLNVHEGPQSIRPQDNGIEIEPGMVSSNEPGVYRRNAYGIRIENLIISKIKEESEFGTFMEFETLTLCPIDKTLIDKGLLTEEEIAWFNNYHQQVAEKLSPLLDDEHKKWLQEKTAAL